eukprot:GILJ01024598.1.p1 GENE.GILJ01024598.1~~GILJ01024598.1.p1  ORF type:complete len:501 (-),score=42.80 GILJ01024598.1:277-1779(-)
MMYDTVLVFGVFDLFHSLHKQLLDHAVKVTKSRLHVFLYGKNTKWNRTLCRSVDLTDSIQKRLHHVSGYLVLQQHRQISRDPTFDFVVQPMMKKHLETVRDAIAQHRRYGSVAIVGGVDQFEDYPTLTDLCNQTQTAIVKHERGDHDTELCSSDWRRYNNAVNGVVKWLDLAFNERNATTPHVASTTTIATIDPRFWKQEFKTRQDAKKYLTRPLDGVFYYQPRKCIDRKIQNAKASIPTTPPTSEHVPAVITLPGRTSSSLTRIRKIFQTVEEMTTNTNTNFDQYVFCYRQTENTTRFHLEQLATNPQQYYSEEAMMLVELLLIPFLNQHTRQWKRKVVFFARSRGSVFVLEVENALCHYLTTTTPNITSCDIRRLCKQVSVISVSNMAPFHHERRFHTVTFTGLNDKKTRVKESWPTTSHSLPKPGIHWMSPTHCAVLDFLPTNITTRIERTNEIVNIQDDDAHYTPLYISMRLGENNWFPRLITHTLCKILSLSPLL